MTPTDNHTVPSSVFKRVATTVDTLPHSPSHVHETQVLPRTQFSHQKISNSNNAFETLARQISASTMNGNDISYTNGQSTIIVKDPKVIPSTELIGAVTRAKDG